LAAVFDTIPWVQLTLGPLFTVLGLLFLVQTFRIRFVFTEVTADKSCALTRAVFAILPFEDHGLNRRVDHHGMRC
jgi:hypothetical protein